MKPTTWTVYTHSSAGTLNVEATSGLDAARTIRDRFVDAGDCHADALMKFVVIPHAMILTGHGKRHGEWFTLGWRVCAHEPGGSLEHESSPDWSGPRHPLGRPWRS